MEQMADIMIGSAPVGCIIRMPGTVEMKLLKEEGTIEFFIIHFKSPVKSVEYYLFLKIYYIALRSVNDYNERKKGAFL